MRIMILGLGLFLLPCLSHAGTGTVVLSTNPVTQIISGAGISVSPSDGRKVVTISTSGFRSEGEVPVGTIDGSNRDFVMAHASKPANSASAVLVFSDGIRVNTNQYTIAVATLSFVPGTVNIPINSLTVDYSY